MIQIEVLFFARLKREAGVSQTRVVLPEPCTVRLLAQHLAETLQINLSGCMVAVNENYATPETALTTGSRVAFLPPVAGGSSDTECFVVTDAVLDIQAAYRFLARPAWGGQAFFTGTVRSPNKGMEIEYIDYEAFELMTVMVMKHCADQARVKFDIGGVYLAHRTGRLYPGDLSIIVGVGSPHRRAALEACDFLIETLKVKLPVWKLERSTRGEEWVEGTTSSPTL